ncbi:PPE domain-containing protein [Saccharopolyspora sp. NFXS83]|uniref:PPE domain-containing protein n=1 Tax=Saccharopolyspora sp. NFXS83 TaxID=2993560 RepID=UPI00224B7964|nr:PPE domain-containing protein [Saccharopolyspora sp. NFXS83]MCX2733596.1 PPE domain-containing protein [Saccharopolyspora sp. NFXS83]
MSDHRWQGYRHEELYEQIHQGPGADGSTDSVRRWSELTRTLGNIDSDLAAALNSAMSGWQGDAAENARGGLRPLGDWALQAQQAAELMRDRTEQQATFVGKARADMPQPQPTTTEDPGTAITGLVHLFGGQTDYEVQEARQNAAEQRAFEVMRTYESSTQANTTSLASFTPPPQVVVDGPASSPGAPKTWQQPGITISWGGTPVPAPRAAPGSTAGVQGSRRQSGRGSGGRGSERGRTHPTGSGGAGRTRRREDDSVDRAVTEQVGGGTGFFDEPQTLSRPVIGGDLDR